MCPPKKYSSNKPIKIKLSEGKILLKLKTNFVKISFSAPFAYSPFQVPAWGYIGNKHFQQVAFLVAFWQQKIFLITNFRKEIIESENIFWAPCPESKEKSNKNIWQNNFTNKNWQKLDANTIPKSKVNIIHNPNLASDLSSLINYLEKSLINRKKTLLLAPNASYLLDLINSSHFLEKQKFFYLETAPGLTIEPETPPLFYSEQLKKLYQMKNNLNEFNKIQEKIKKQILKQEKIKEDLQIWHKLNLINKKWLTLTQKALNYQEIWRLKEEKIKKTQLNLNVLSNKKKNLKKRIWSPLKNKKLTDLKNIFKETEVELEKIEFDIKEQRIEQQKLISKADLLKKELKAIKNTSQNISSLNSLQNQWNASKMFLFALKNSLKQAQPQQDEFITSLKKELKNNLFTISHLEHLDAINLINKANFEHLIIICPQNWLRDKNNLLKIKNQTANLISIWSDFTYFDLKKNEINATFYCAK